LVAVIAAIFNLFSFAAGASPETNGRALADRVAKAHLSGQQFTKAILFEPAAGHKHAGILDAETNLQPIGGAITSLFATHPDAVSITLKTETGSAYTLEMLRSYPTAEHPDMGVYDAGGRHAVGYTSGLHYQGALAGNDHSIATMSVFANGEVAVLFGNEEGNFVLGKLEDGSGKYILYNDRDLHGHRAGCATPDPPAGTISYDGIKSAKTAKNLLCNRVRLYWEVAYQLYTFKGSNLSNVQNYVTTLFNQVQAMYANESIVVELSSMYVWTTPDVYPVFSIYSGNASSYALYSFRDYWNTMQAGFSGDLAHLLTHSGVSLGGVAYVNALCNAGINYAFSDVDGAVNNIPTWSWDVEVLTHETGHNLGSKHTQWCGWMTGPGSTCGSIDNCVPQESSPSCSSCSFSTFSTSAPGWQGTVMSYCHLVSGRGIDLANGFGTLPGNAIRSNVSNSVCLRSTINGHLIPSSVCTNEGTVTFQFATDNYGVAPYSYNWNTGAQTQNISNLTNAGTYSVTVTDDNRCTRAFSTAVQHVPTSGDVITPSIQMPVCCNTYYSPLIIKAAPPQGYTSCHSIYWLRSTMALTSSVDAQAYFDTTNNVQNVLKSANEGSIASGAVGAAVNIIPEPCSTVQSWYYTPVLVQSVHVADTIAYTSNSDTDFVSATHTQIGTSTTIPDQTAVPSTCDLLDTPTFKGLSVSVTSYTGRANKMRIVIFNANDEVLYLSPYCPGNGIYTIPDSAISGNFLQALQIAAIDYNCTTSAGTTNCASSQATVRASRILVYGTQRPSKVVANCALSPSIRVDFAPAGCSMLSVMPTAVITNLSVVPNPAASFVTLKFNMQQAGQVDWKINDMAGRTILPGSGHYSSGAHSVQIDISELSRGIYFVNLGNGAGLPERVKLILQ
jgi:hypothetical protein